MKNSPPDGRPNYILLTNVGDEKAFCEKINESLAIGYQLQGSPAITFTDGILFAAQALVWPKTPAAKPRIVRENEDDGAGSDFQPKPRGRSFDRGSDRGSDRAPRRSFENSDDGGFKSPRNRDDSGFKPARSRFGDDRSFRQEFTRSTNGKSGGGGKSRKW